MAASSTSSSCSCQASTETGVSQCRSRRFPGVRNNRVTMSARSRPNNRMHPASAPRLLSDNINIEELCASERP